jgi:dTDP-4-amino-4,6-dideoxygalactose transaminase
MCPEVGMAHRDRLDNGSTPSEWQVPRTNAPKIHRRMQGQLLEAISPVLFGDAWEAQQIVVEFERKFALEMGYRFVSAVQSGSAGLRLSLLACGVEPGDEVITVANSDIATTAAISHCGATPVLCDVSASDYTIDAQLVEALISERTVGLLPVDLYGHPADVYRLREIADRHDLFIIEDAAIATGARDRELPLGAFADMTVFSCSPYKPFDGIGNGGLVVTENQTLWERVELLKGFGLQPGEPKSLPVKYDHLAEGYNLKMTPVDAAVLSVKLPYLRGWSEERRRIGSWYRERLTGIEDVKLPSFRPESEPIFRTYTIRVRARDLVYRRLQEGGVQAALHYVPPVHLQPIYRDRDLPGSDRLRVTERLGEDILCLPVAPEMSREDVHYACELLLSVLENSR